MVQRSSGNDALQSVLREVGWSSYELARRINRALGAGFVHRTTPRSWCIAGVTPRDPLPATVARLLSEEAGRLVRPQDLWATLGDPRPLGAHEGLTAAWTSADLANVIVEVGAHRHEIVCLSGSDLIQHTRGWRRQASSGQDRLRIVPADEDPVVEHLRDDLARLRTMDEGLGGRALLTLVAHQQRLLATLAVQYGERSWQSHQCIDLLAQYTQFAGWLALDIGEHGRAQRSLFLALRLCQLTGDSALASLVMSCLAVQAVARGRPQDACSLSEQATAGQDVGSPISWMRRARSSAAIGDAVDFQRSIEQARGLLHEAAMPLPAWGYWLTDDLLVAEEGRGWADLRAARRARPLLTRVVTSPTAGGRDRVLYGAALVQAHLQDGALDDACSELQQTLAHLPGTSSRRCRDLLHTVINDMSDAELSGSHLQSVADAERILAAEAIA